MPAAAGRRLALWIAPGTLGAVAEYVRVRLPLPCGSDTVPVTPEGLVGMGALVGPLEVSETLCVTGVGCMEGGLVGGVVGFGPGPPPPPQAASAAAATRAPKRTKRAFTEAPYRGGAG